MNYEFVCLESCGSRSRLFRLFFPVFGQVWSELGLCHMELSGPADQEVKPVIGRDLTRNGWTLFARVGRSGPQHQDVLARDSEIVARPCVRTASFRDHGPYTKWSVQTTTGWRTFQNVVPGPRQCRYPIKNAANAPLAAPPTKSLLQGIKHKCSIQVVLEHDELTRPRIRWYTGR